MDQDRLEAVGAQAIEGRLGAGRVEEVREDDDHPLAAVPAHEAGRRQGQVGAPTGDELIEEAEHRVDPPASAQRAHAVGQLGGEGVDRDPIAAPQPDVGQRRRGLAGDLQLGARADAHRGAAVEQHVHGQLLVLVEQADQRPAMRP